jgi:hypothetical protein
MPRQIIVLDTNIADGGYITCKVVFWIPVAVSRRIPKLTFQSAIDNTLAGSQQVTASESDDLKSGAVLEEIGLYRFPNSYTTAQIKTELQAAYTSRAAYVASLPNPIAFYGVSWDGAAWSS